MDHEDVSSDLKALFKTPDKGKESDQKTIPHDEGSRKMNSSTGTNKEGSYCQRGSKNMELTPAIEEFTRQAQAYAHLVKFAMKRKKS